MLTIQIHISLHFTENKKYGIKYCQNHTKTDKILIQ
jgi:hypothetical protein